MTGALDAGLGVYRQALALRGYRQEILSADIANASTPGFKAVDLNFAQAMSNALGTQLPAASLTTNSSLFSDGAAGDSVAGDGVANGGPRALLVSDPRHLSMLGTAEPDPKAAVADAVQYQVGSQSTIDGNTVDIDQEKVTAAGNAVDYAATATFATQTIKMLLTAIGAAGSQTGGA